MPIQTLDIATIAELDMPIGISGAIPASDATSDELFDMLVGIAILTNGCQR